MYLQSYILVLDIAWVFYICSYTMQALLLREIWVGVCFLQSLLKETLTLGQRLMKIKLQLFPIILHEFLELCAQHSKLGVIKSHLFCVLVWLTLLEA